MSLLEKIKVFVSNEDLLSEFIDTINKILKIEAWVKGCELKNFCELLNNWFKIDISLNEKKISWTLSRAWWDFRVYM